MICQPSVGEKLKPGTHAATFGGNPLACAAALATIETIEADGLLARSHAIGERFRSHFEKLKTETPLVAEIRIKGTMIGLQLAIEGAPVVAECLKRGLLINCTHATVIRLLPSLTLTDPEIDAGCDILAAAIKSLTP